MDVGTLSCRILFQSVSASLQNGIRFFHPPKPAHLSARLAARFPVSILQNQEIYGVSTFHINTTLSNLGSARPPVAPHLRRRTLEPPFLTTYLLVKACQHLWLLLNDGSAAVHMMVNPIALSWLPTAVDAGRVELASQLALQEPKFFGLHYKTLHTQRSSTPRRMALLDTGGRTPGRIRSPEGKRCDIY